MKTINEKLIISELNFMDGIIDGDKLYFYDSIMNGFFSLNLIDGEMKNIRIDKKNKGIYGVCRKIININNFYYFIYTDLCAVSCYELLEDGLHFISDYKGEGFKVKVKNAFLCDEKIMFFSNDINDGIAIFDISTGTFEYAKISINGSNNFLNKTRDIIKCETSLYLIFEESNDLFVIDYKNSKKELIKSSIPGQIEGLAKRDDKLIIREKYGKKIYSLDIKTKQYEIIAESDYEHEKMGKVAILTDGTIVLCPILSNSFYYVDESSGKVEMIANEIECDNNKTFSVGCAVYNNKLLVFPWACKNIIEIYRNDENDICARKVQSFINQKNSIEYHKNKLIVENMVLESDSFTLDEFIECI